MPIINILSGLFPTNQQPLDAKRYAKTLAELQDLGTSNFKAFYYHDRLRVLCLENNKEYVWREEATLGETSGLVSGGYTYPANTIADGIDYSGKTFNFFEREITVQPKDVPTEDFGAVWTGNNFDYAAYANLYIIGGSIYSAQPTTVVLPAAPATVGEKVKHAIIATTAGIITFVSSAESPAPEDPDINESTQRLITIVTISNGQTAPDNLSDVQAYDEGIGSPTEYDATESTGGARFSLVSTNNPNLNTKCIEGINVQDGDMVILTADQLNTFEDLSSLYFELETPNVGASISVYFRNGSTIVTEQVLLEPSELGYLGALAGYQFINIPKGRLLPTDQQFDNIVFVFNGYSSAGIDLVRIDNVRVIYGGDPFVSISNRFLTLEDVDDSNYIGKVGRAFIVNENETGLESQVIPKFIDIFGPTQNLNGNVIPLGGLDYQVWSSAYLLNGKYYPDLPYLGEVRGNVTISPADANFDRFVSFYIQNDGINQPTVGFIEGPAQNNPPIPSLPSPDIQVLIGTLRISAGSGSGTTTEIVTNWIFLENNGEPTEWTIINLPVEINPNDTTVANTDTKSVLFPAGTSSDKLKFQNDAPVKYDPNGYLRFAVYLDTIYPKGGTIGPGGTASLVKITLRDNTLGITSTFHATDFSLSRSGMNPNKTKQWQLIQFSLDNFSLNNYPNFGIDEVWFEMINTPKMNFDDIALETGVQVSTPGVRTFLDLIDTPNTYQGHGGKLLAIREDETGVEFVEKTSSDNRKLKVINIVDNTQAPPTENDGDRYILDNTGASNAAWDGASAWDIVQFNGTSGLWEAESPIEGWELLVDNLDVDYWYIDDGTGAWEEKPSGTTYKATFESEITAATTVFDGTQKGEDKIYPFNSSNPQTLQINQGDYVKDDVIHTERRQATLEYLQGTNVRFRGDRDSDNRYFAAIPNCFVSLKHRGVDALGNDVFSIFGRLKGGNVGAVSVSSIDSTLPPAETKTITFTGTGFSANTLVRIVSGNATIDSTNYVSNSSFQIEFTSSGVDAENVVIEWDNGELSQYTLTLTATEYVGTNHSFADGAGGGLIKLSDTHLKSVQVQRSSDNATGDILFNGDGKVWEDSIVDGTGQDLATWMGASDLSVLTVYNAGGLGGNWISMGVNHPKLAVAGVLKKKDGVVFMHGQAANTEWMEQQTAIEWGIGRATISIVQVNVGTGGGAMVSDRPDSGFHTFNVDNGRVVDFNGGNITLSGGAAVDNALVKKIALKATGNSFLYEDGVLTDTEAQASSVASTPNKIRFGRFQTSQTDWKINNFIIWRTEKNGADAVAINALINSRL